MSRTRKDVPRKFAFPEEAWDYGFEVVGTVSVQYMKYDPVSGESLLYTSAYTRNVYLKKPGVRTKKKRSVDNSWHWYSATPSWWTRLTMNRPQRRNGKLWERKVLFEDVESTDPPLVSRKPHVYYH